MRAFLIAVVLGAASPAHAVGIRYVSGDGSYSIELGSEWQASSALHGLTRFFDPQQGMRGAVGPVVPPEKASAEEKIAEVRASMVREAPAEEEPSFGAIQSRKLGNGVEVWFYEKRGRGAREVRAAFKYKRRLYSAVMAERLAADESPLFAILGSLAKPGKKDAMLPSELVPMAPAQHQKFIDRSIGGDAKRVLDEEKGKTAGEAAAAAARDAERREQERKLEEARRLTRKPRRRRRVKPRAKPGPTEVMEMPEDIPLGPVGPSGKYDRVTFIFDKAPDEADLEEIVKDAGAQFIGDAWRRTSKGRFGAVAVRVRDSESKRFIKAMQEKFEIRDVQRSR